MKRLLGLRRRHPTFGRGSFSVLEPVNTHVLAYMREYQGQALLVANNLSRFAQPMELELKNFRGWTPVEMFGHTRFPPVEDAPYTLTLAPHGFLWFRMER